MVGWLIGIFLADEVVRFSRKLHGGTVPFDCVVASIFARQWSGEPSLWICGDFGVENSGTNVYSWMMSTSV